MSDSGLVCGIDLGSRSVKLVLMDKNGLRWHSIMETVAFYREFGERTPEGMAVRFDSLGIGAVSAVAATGYGRNTLNIVRAVVIAELKAHTLGAIDQTGLRDFTLLDLGGQDSKVVKVRSGRMADFQTNDKCAASTGRYLENMAAVLGLSLDELGAFSRNPAELSSTCAIFGETELIGRIVEGYPVEELAAGVNYSIYRRIKPMLAALSTGTVVFAGGVAHNLAIRHYIETELGARVVVPPHPQLNGAIGCAAHVLAKGE